MTRKISLPRVIESERLILKRVQASEVFAQKLFSVLEENRTNLDTFFGGLNKKTGTLPDTLAQLNRDDSDFAEGRSSQYYLEVAGQIAGGIRVNYLRDQTAELMYWLNQKYQHQGLMSEAVQSLEPTLYRFGFKNILGFCDPKNKASQKLLLNAGYTLRYPDAHMTIDPAEEILMEFVKKRPTHMDMRTMKLLYDMQRQHC